MTTQRRNSPARAAFLLAAAVMDDVIGLQTKERDKRMRPVVNCVLLQCAAWCVLTLGTEEAVCSCE
jgi:hypothetical protein